MAIHKREEFTQKEQDLAAFAKAFSHPARITNLSLQEQQKSSTCGSQWRIITQD